MVGCGILWTGQERRTLCVRQLSDTLTKDLGEVIYRKQKSCALAPGFRDAVTWFYCLGSWSGSIGVKAVAEQISPHRGRNQKDCKNKGLGTKRTLQKHVLGTHLLQDIPSYGFMNVLVHRWGQSPHDPGATFSTCFLSYLSCFFLPPTVPFRKSSSIAVWKQQWVNDKYLISLNCHKVDTLSPKIYIVSRNATRSYLWTLMYWVATWESLGAGLIFSLSTGFRESTLEILGTICLTLPPHSPWSSLFLEKIHVTDALLRQQSEFTPTALCPDPPGWALRWAVLTHNTP